MYIMNRGRTSSLIEKYHVYHDITVLLDSYNDSYLVLPCVWTCPRTC